MATLGQWEFVQWALVVAAGLLLAALSMVWLWHASARPSIIERLERSMVSNQTRLEMNQTRLDTQEGEIDELRRQIQELREGRLADHALLQEWIAYARRLAEMFRAATGQEPPEEPPGQPRPLVTRPTTGKPGQLAALIVAAFSLDEMTGLAFELGIEGDVTGATTKARAQSLVGQANRRGLTERLIELCREQRPEGGF